MTDSRPSPAHALPGAFLVALVCLAVLELFIRCIDPQWLIVTTGDLNTVYRGVSNHIRIAPPCDICLIGSSRVQEGLHVAPLQAALDRRGDPRIVTNYGLNATGTPEIAILVERLLEHDPPDHLVIGISAHTFVLDQPRGDYRFELQSTPKRASSLRTLDLRNTLGDYFVLARYRDRLPVLLSDTAAWVLHPNRPLSTLARPGAIRGVTRVIYGESPPRQHRAPDRSLQTHPMSFDEILGDLVNVTGQSTFAFQPERWREFEATIAFAEQRGVQVTVLEVPLSRALEAVLGPRVVEAFGDHLNSLPASSVITLVELGLNFSDRDFLEYSHLNGRGARQWTHALAQHLPPFSGNTPVTP